MRKAILGIASGLGSLPLAAFAIETTSAPGATGIASLGDIYTVVKVASQWLVVFGIIIGAIFVIVGGIQYMTAGGDEEGTKAAKAKIIGGLIGIAIVLLAFALVNIVGSFLGAGTIVTP